MSFELELRIIADLEDGVECWEVLTSEEKPKRTCSEGIWQWRRRVRILAKEICIKRIAKVLGNVPV